MMLFAAFEIATVGYFQVMVDGAAFLAAHEQALGVANVASVVQTVFSQVDPAAISTAATAVDDTQVPVNYNLADSQHRHGGVALMRPQHLQSTVSKSNIGGLLTFDGTPTNPITLTGSFIEPNNLTVDPGFNIAGDDPNNVQASDRASYFGSNENVPPFMIGFHMFRHCSDWYFDTSCSAFNFLAAGLGEYLDEDNWGPGKSNGVGNGATFQAMACHQRVYATIAANDLPAAYPGPQSTPWPGAPPPQYDETNSSSDFNKVLQWDVPVNGGYSLQQSSVGAYPLHPLAGC